MRKRNRRDFLQTSTGALAAALSPRGQASRERTTAEEFSSEGAAAKMASTIAANEGKKPLRLGLVIGIARDPDAAMAKVYASEMLGRVCDAAVQIFGGMGLMSDLPVERWWRDARVERIWDGTSEIQRHIISRALLRLYGG